MEMPDNLIEFIAESKRAGATLDEMWLVAQTRGWSAREFREAHATVFESTTGLAAPARRQPNESAALDGFLYALSTILLCVLVVNLLTLTSDLVDEWFDATRPAYQSSTSDMGWAIAGIVVACPFYLILMWVINRRYALGITPRNSGVRSWVLAFTLLAGTAAVMGYLISGVGQILGGQNLQSDLTTTGISIAVLCAFTGYYLWMIKHTREEA